MPFCRECGKQVEDGWVTCPYCPQPIGPPNSAMLGVQDSVIVGDINIGNDQKLECPNCMSIGAPIITCKECNELCACTICQDDPEFSKQFWGFESSKLEKTELGIICLDCAKEFAATICNRTCTHCSLRFELPDSELRGDDDIEDKWCTSCNTLSSFIEGARLNDEVAFEFFEQNWKWDENKYSQ